MNSQSHLKSVASLIGPSYAGIAFEGRASLSQAISNLLNHRRLPDEGWTESQILEFLYQLANMDSNNFLGVVGAGEREGRVFSSIIRQRHFEMSHGIGRSGDLMAKQPKAAGSSLMSLLTQCMLHDLFTRTCGIASVGKCLLLPTSTGMTLSLCFQYIKQSRPTGQFIIYSRLDQKSAIKSMVCAGMTPIVVGLSRTDDVLGTNLNGIRESINRYGCDAILCVLSTTSSYSPRAPDNVPEIAKICNDLDIPHVVNNAYGLQCSRCCHLIEVGSRVGRVDFFVQSADKNLMVPVGGAIVASPDPKKIDQLSNFYPGRASASSTMDVFVTLLQLGHRQYAYFRNERKRLMGVALELVEKMCDRVGVCRVIKCPANKISIAICLDDLGDGITELGSLLFRRRMTGARVVAPTGKNTKVGCLEFWNFNTHDDNSTISYLNVAVTIGTNAVEVEKVVLKIEETIREFLKMKSQEIT